MPRLKGKDRKMATAAAAAAAAAATAAASGTNVAASTPEDMVSSSLPPRAAAAADVSASAPTSTPSPSLSPPLTSFSTANPPSSSLPTVPIPFSAPPATSSSRPLPQASSSAKKPDPKYVRAQVIDLLNNEKPEEAIEKSRELCKLQPDDRSNWCLQFKAYAGVVHLRFKTCPQEETDSMIQRAIVCSNVACQKTGRWKPEESLAMASQLNALIQFPSDQGGISEKCRQECIRHCNNGLTAAAGATGLGYFETELKKLLECSLTADKAIGTTKPKAGVGTDVKDTEPAASNDEKSSGDTTAGDNVEDAASRNDGKASTSSSEPKARPRRRTSSKK